MKKKVTALIGNKNDFLQSSQIEQRLEKGGARDYYLSPQNTRSSNINKKDKNEITKNRRHTIMVVGEKKL